MGFFSRVGSAFKASVKAPFRATANVGKATFRLGKTVALQPIRTTIQTAKFVRKPSKGGFFSLLTSPVKSIGGGVVGVGKASAAVPFAPATAFGRTLVARKRAAPRKVIRRGTGFRPRPILPKPGGLFGFLTQPTFRGTPPAPGTPAAAAAAAAPGTPAPYTPGAASTPTGVSHAAYDIPGGSEDEDAGVPSSGGSAGPEPEQGDDTSSQTDLEAALERATGTTMSTSASPAGRDTDMTTAGDEQPFEYGGSSGDHEGDSAEEAYSSRLPETVDAGDGVEIPVHMYEPQAAEEGDDRSDAGMYAEGLGLADFGDFKSDLGSGLRSFGTDVAKEGASRILTGTAKALEGEAKKKPKVEYEVEAPKMSTGKKLAIGAAVAVPAIIILARILRPKKATNPRRRRRRR
jgi:hypothetical protein